MWSDSNIRFPPGRFKAELASSYTGLVPWASFTAAPGTGKIDDVTATRPPRGSVLLVEDEVMIRMMVADMLKELGYTIAAEAGEIGEAMRLAETTFFDLAILDVNVNGKVISPVADLLKARNRPFIFATGYGFSGLPEEYRDRPSIQKPFQIEILDRIIDSVLRNSKA